jgi:L-malate glycosyltransferase
VSSILFFWENFGPTHVDRCDAVARAMPRRAVFGIELNPTSSTYAWDREGGQHFTKITLRDEAARWGTLRTALELVGASLKSGARHIFLCHYNEPSVQIAAILLRVLGKRLYLLLDSKFDDRPRAIRREALKAIWIWPYVGAIVGSRRSRQYLTFLGLRNGRIENYYDTISVERIRRSAGVPPAPDGVDFHDRHFTIVSRLVEKKNLFVAVDAFALYVSRTNHPRRLRIFGDGRLDQELREHVRELNMTELVSFEGFQQTNAVSQALGSTLALIQSSSEEQFGIAIIEALAMGVPVIVSDNCGARDEFVRSGVNGFIVQPDNVEGIAFFLGKLASDQLLWERLSAGTIPFAEEADAMSFARSVDRLTASS